MTDNYYSFLEQQNSPTPTGDENPGNAGIGATPSEEETPQEEKPKADESQHRAEEAPAMPPPVWFTKAQEQLKDKIVADVKEQFDEEQRQKMEEARRRQEEAKAQAQLQLQVAAAGGNTQGLGNGDFKDPHANDPERVQKEGSMATVDKKPPAVAVQPKA